MTPYSIALFLHVVGALGLFSAMGIEWVLVARLYRAESADEARGWLNLPGVIRRLSPTSLAVLLLAGIYMTITVWGGVGWIVVAFVALLLLPPLGMITGLRLPAIERDITAESGPLSPEVRRRLHDPLFQASIQIRTAIVLGIVFLMTTKPDATTSAIAMVVAVALGVAVSVPALNRARQRRLSGQPA